MSIPTTCYSGLVPADKGAENLEVNNSLRVKSAAIAKLCALVESDNLLLVGSVSGGSISDPLDTYMFLNGPTDQSTNQTATLSHFLYTPVNVSLSNFNFSYFSTGVPTQVNVSIVTTTDFAVAPTEVANLSFSLTGLTNSVTAHASAAGPVTIPAGSYIGLNVNNNNQIIAFHSFRASWSLEITQLS